jgi:hypothetical protein
MGEHKLKVSSPEVVMVGGNFTQCQTTSMFDLIANYQGTGKLKIKLPISAIFRGLGGYADSLKDIQREISRRNGPAAFEDYLMRELESFEATSFAKLNLTAEVKMGNKSLGTIGSGSKLVEISFIED